MKNQPFECVSRQPHFFEFNQLRPPRLSSVVACFSILTVFFAFGCSPSNVVVVKKAEASVNRHVYDKGNRPEDRVSSHPSVEANTHWDFEFVPEIGVERVSLKMENHQFVSVVRVKKVEIALALPIQIWLPASATPKVVEHETGHIEICRQFYSNAENCARIAAEGIINREFSGVGATESESMRLAIESAGSALTVPFRDSVILPANKASSIYDELTKHGQAAMRVDVAVRTAIAQAK